MARYKNARGKGGFVRASWSKVSELIAPNSYSAGTWFLSVTGGTIVAFYDWYADLPTASPGCPVTRLTFRGRVTGGTC